MTSRLFALTCPFHPRQTIARLVGSEEGPVFLAYLPPTKEEQRNYAAFLRAEGVRGRRLDLEDDELRIPLSDPYDHFKTSVSSFPPFRRPRALERMDDYRQLARWAGSG